MAASARISPQSSYVLSLLRVVAGFTFTQHGVQKLLGLLGGMGGHGARAHFLSIFWFAGIIEVIGGVLIVLGLFTRPVALILCGEMAFAYFHAHAPRGFWTLQNGGELAVLYCFLFLYLFAAGAGPVSLDRFFRRRDL